MFPDPSTSLSALPLNPPSPPSHCGSRLPSMSAAHGRARQPPPRPGHRMRTAPNHVQVSRARDAQARQRTAGGIRSAGTDPAADRGDQVAVACGRARPCILRSRSPRTRAVNALAWSHDPQRLHLVRTPPDCVTPDPGSRPRPDAIPVPPRRGVRARWSRAALLKHEATSSNPACVSNAEDTTPNGREASNIRDRASIAGRDIKATVRLAEQAEISVGMEAVVTLHIATDADPANGARGEIIVEVVSNPRDGVAEPDESTGLAHLRRPPATTTPKPSHCTFPRLNGLQDLVTQKYMYLFLY